MGTWNTARLHLSSMTHGVDWPWSGSVRKIIYVDFFIYLVLLVLFCCITLLPTTNTSFDAYKLVQSVQSTLLEEVCLCISALLQAYAQMWCMCQRKMSLLFCLCQAST